MQGGKDAAMQRCHLFHARSMPAMTSPQTRLPSPRLLRRPFHAGSVGNQLRIHLFFPLQPEQTPDAENASPHVFPGFPTSPPGPVTRPRTKRSPKTPTILASPITIAPKWFIANISAYFVKQAPPQRGENACCRHCSAVRSRYPHDTTPINRSGVLSLLDSARPGTTGRGHHVRHISI